MEGSPCLVCSVSIRETHCGFEVCRELSKQEGDSLVDKAMQSAPSGNVNEKFACRYCRLTRCKEIGMEFQTEPTTILELIRREYDQSVTRRKQQEMHLIQKFKLKVVDEAENLYQTNLNIYYAMYPIIIRELKVFLHSFIPDFGTVSDQLKDSIFPGVIGKFIALECYFQTSKRFQGYGRCMCTLLTCFDLDKCEEWIADREMMIRKDDMISTLRSYASEYLTILHQTLKMAQFTDTQFHALIAIGFCDMDATIHLPDNINCIFERVRVKVFEELQNYYRNELKISDYSTRIGSLMSLSAVLSELHNNSHEQLNLYAALFGVKSQCELLREAMN